MLPVGYRMTRSTDFGATVRHGVRGTQPDLVVHVLRAESADGGDPKIGLVVAKSVGGAVERHRVARKLRHVAYATIVEMRAGDRVVVRALPGSLHASSARLAEQLRTALRRTERLRTERRRTEPHRGETG